MQAGEDFSHFCDDQKNKCFTIYTLRDKRPQKYEIPYETTYLFDSVQIGNQVYFTGGGMPAGAGKGETFLQTARRVTIKADMDTIIEQLPNMNVSRANHTMVALTPLLIYVIGGCNTKAELPSCEEFAVDKKKWREVACLNEKKMWPAVSAFESRYLYAFGGSTNLTPKESNTIECLDTHNPAAKLWTIIVSTTGKDSLPRFFFAGSLQVAPNAILIFGGLVNKVEMDDTFIFDPIAKTVVKGEKLPRPDAFYRTKPALFGSDMIVVGSCVGDLYKFNIPSKKWQMTTKSAWNPEMGFFVKSETA